MGAIPLTWRPPRLEGRFDAHRSDAAPMSVLCRSEGRTLVNTCGRQARLMLDGTTALVAAVFMATTEKAHHLLAIRVLHAEV
jgi:hypothetical protein